MTLPAVRSQPGTTAFSLVEILAVLGLLVMILGLTVVQVRGGGTGGSAGARGLAMTLAGELKAARQKAIETRTPVAVGLPSAGGTRPHSQSLYQLEGIPHPRITRINNLAGEFPGAYLAVGTWSGTTPTVDSPRVTPPGSLLLSGWLAPPRSDFIFAFDHDGNLLTNDLPWFGGRCHVVACSGLDFTGTGTPPGTPDAGASVPGYFDFTRVYQPFTVSLDPTGTVFLDSGLPDANSSVALPAGGAQPAMPPAAPPPLVSTANTDPVIEEIQVLPVNNAGLASSFNTSVAANGYVTLIVRASDADGDKLSCSWACSQGSKSGKASAVSHLPGGGQLAWDPRENVWKSVWVWNPPPDADDDDAFTLNCTVVDDRGGSVSAAGASGLTMNVRNAGKVAFSGPDLAAGSTVGEIFVCNPDGTGARRLTNNTVDDRQPCLSPDGTKIVFSSQLNGGSFYHIFRMNVDGSGLEQLTGDDGTNHTCPVFSPDGTQIAFAKDDGKVYKRDATGAVTELAQGSNPAWNPVVGNNSVAFLGTNGNVCVHDGTTATDVTLTGLVGNPSWALDGKYVLYTNLATGNLIAVNAVSATNMADKGNAQGSVSPLRFSTAPGPPQLVFATTAGIFRADDPGGAAPLFNVQPITPYGVGGVNYPSWGP